jgi:hypothetical protein
MRILIIDRMMVDFLYDIDVRAAGVENKRYLSSSTIFGSLIKHCKCNAKKIPEMGNIS